MMEQAKIKILTGCGIILLLAVLVFLALTAWSWNDLHQIHYPDTTTFIGSSDVYQLGCYPENTVQSVTINKTGSTVVYSSDQSSNPALVNIKLNKTEAIPVKDPYHKFQVYHRVSNEPLYTVHNGHITYSFTVQKIEITDNCTLDIYAFDSYSELAKFLNTGERFRSINRTCLTTKKIKDVFVVNFTLPSLQYTYIAGIAIAVNEMNYSTVAGSVTTYDTSNYKQECTDNDDNTCLVKIGGSYGTRSHDRCVYVGQVLRHQSEVYMYIKSEITKVDANPLTASMTTLLAVFFLILFGSLISLGVYCKCRCNPIVGARRRSPTEETVLNNSDGNSSTSKYDTITDGYRYTAAEDTLDQTRP